MKKKHLIFIGVLFCLFIAGCAYFWATNLMQSLYDYRSPLSNTPPITNETTGQAITSKVVIILVDALRVDTANDPNLMPFLNSLHSNAAWGIMHSQPPSYSEPGWTTILTGAWPEISDGPAINLDYENIYPFSQDNIFSSAHRLGLTTAISGYYWFEKLLPSGSVNYSFYTEGEDDLADQAVLSAALPWLQDKNINLILIHLDQVDFAGHHEGGPQGEAWGDAANRVDAMIKIILGELDLTQDIAVILSDHGQIDPGGHGGQETIVLTEPFLIIGKSVVPDNHADIQMVDIAPTIAVLLGTNIPGTNQGQPLLDMFGLKPDKVSKVQVALDQQQELLLKTYLDAINPNGELVPIENTVKSTQNAILLARDSRLRTEILLRVIILLFLGICLYFLIRRQSFAMIASYVLTGIIYVAIFNFRYSILDKHPYSLSWIPSQIELLMYISFTSIISFLISWLFFIIIRKAYIKPTQDIALNTLTMTSSTILITAIPVFISYAINGPLVSWTLPDMFTMYLSFIALLQCLIIAVFGIIFSMMSFFVHKLAQKSAGVN